MNKMFPNPKIIFTVVKKDMAKKVVQAAKEAGISGATIVYCTGIGCKEKDHFLGIPIEREREMIITVVTKEQSAKVMNAIKNTAKFHLPRTGICFLLNLKNVSGVQRPVKLIDEKTINEEDELMVRNGLQYDLIVTIVNKGDASVVVETSRNHGADGATIVHGRGTGVHERAKLFNITIEPEKEIVLTLVDRNKTAGILEAIHEEAELQKPGKGIAFVLEVEQVAGINHEINQMLKENHFKQQDK